MRLFTALLLPVLAASTTKPDFASLEAQMRDQRTLNGWDILVSYDKPTLQKIVQQQISTSNNTLTIPAFNTTDRNPFTDTVSAIWTVNLKFGSPKLVITNSGFALNFPLRGKFARGDQNSTGKAPGQPIPSGLSLQVASEFYSTTGTMKNKKFVSDGNATQTAAGTTVVIVDANGNSTNLVCMAFQGNALNVLGDAPKAQRTSLRRLVLSQLNDHFKRGKFQYCFGGVENAISSANTKRSSVQYVPQAFALSASDDAFHIWIAVEDGPHDGQHPTSPDDLSFQPGDDPTSPIPAGYSSSVILSHDLIVKSYLLPGLGGQISGINEEPQYSLGGLAFTGHPASGSVSIDGQDVRDLHVRSNSFNLIDGTVSISLGSGVASTKAGAQASAKLEYVAPMVPVYFEYDGSWFVAGGSATAQTYFKLNGEGGWSLSRNGSLTFSIASNFKWTQTSYHIVDKTYQYTGPGDNSYFQLRSPGIPESMKFNLPTLDYSLTNNILFPGKFAFVAGTELAQPFDLIIPGNIGIAAAKTDKKISKRSPPVSVRGRAAAADTDAVALAKQYVDQLTTKAMKKGDLARSMLTPNTNASTTMYDAILQGHGFAQLDPLTVMSLAPVVKGSALDKLLSRITELGAVAQNSTTAPVMNNSTTGPDRPLTTDSGVYSPILTGTYRVSKPATLAGRTLSYEGVNRIITFNNYSVTAQRDDSTSLPSFAWTNPTQDKRYNITFTTDLNPATNEIRNRFNGTVRNLVTNIDSVFNGTQAVFSTTALGDPESWQVATYSLVGVTATGVTGGLIYVIYEIRAEKKKEELAKQAAADKEARQAAAEEAASALLGIVRNSKAGDKRDKALNKKAEQVTFDQLDDNNGLSLIVNDQEFKDMVRKAAKDGVDLGMKNLGSVNDRKIVRDLSGSWGDNSKFESGPGLRVQNDALAYVKAKVSEYISQRIGPSEREVIDRMRDFGLSDGFDKIVSQYADKFAADPKLQPLLEGGVSTRFINQNLDLLKSKATTSAAKASIATETLSKARAAAQNKLLDITQLQKEAGNANLNAEERQNYKDKIEKKYAELKELQDNAQASG
ncbi:hypothetical protein KVT40_005028 [Elsinoe batatas]|uniref:Uncharacterized protein n=1 Tax=Elsinoe batatas TaxID=2601811 RepID=A0A8K0L251_9PEZI|nr:hypothetical protein KVT40_005028 [Elsinoe batatas]